MFNLKTIITALAIGFGFLVPAFSYAATPAPKADCEFPVSKSTKQACIDPDTLSTSRTKPTFYGEAKGMSTVYLSLKDENGKLLASRSASVRNGQWEEKITKTLKKGSYTVTLYTSASKTTSIFEGTLTVGSGSTSSSSSSSSATGGSLSASSVPLLFGGAVARGDKAPVAYIKIINSGKATTTIEGFTLTQNGTTPGSQIIGFKTSDDKGGSQTTVGGVEGQSSFVGKTVFVPLKATIAPGQIRIYSLLAIISKNATVGSTLKLDVTGIKTGASVQATYPIRGTTLTVK